MSLPSCIIRALIIGHAKNYYTKLYLVSLYRNPEIPIGVQLVRKFLAFYGTQIWITMFASVNHWTLSATRLIQFVYSPPVSVRSFSILYSRSLIILVGLLPEGFPTELLYAFSVSSIRALRPAHLIHQLHFLKLWNRSLYNLLYGSSCCAVSRGTVLQVGRSRVRFPMG